MPAEKGDARNLTNSPGVHERNPAWSPDGKTIAYFSDEGGEYQLVLAPQNGKGEGEEDQAHRHRVLLRPGLVARLQEAPLSRQLGQPLLLDVESEQDHADRRAEARPRPRAEARRAGRPTRSG